MNVMRRLSNSQSGKYKTGGFCSCCGRRVRFRRGFFFWNRTIFDVERYRSAPQKVICPFCGSLPRHRIIASWCEQHISMIRGKKILVFAPENCMLYWLKKRDIPVTTADLYHRAKLKLDIQDTGLAAGSYDIIFCNHVLEHVDDLSSALKELYRILAKGGLLICSFPIDKTIDKTIEASGKMSRWEHIRMFGQYDHNRLFGRDAKSILAHVGFAVDTIDVRQLPAGIRPVTGPADYDTNVIFTCRKP